MSVIAPTISYPNGDKSVIKVSWALMALNDTGAPFNFTAWVDRSVQVTGTFGAAGNMRWQGSNDGGANYAVLSDPQGTALNLTAANFKQVTEIAEMQRPNITGGDGTTSLTVTLIARRADGLRSR